MDDELKLNDAKIVDQLDGQWFKIATILLWKLRGREKVLLSTDDFTAFENEFAPAGGMMYTHGYANGFSLQVITPADASRLAVEHAEAAVDKALDDIAPRGAT